MNNYIKIILILFGAAYLISPVDVIPDLLVPYLGWLDDGLVIATIIYLIRHGRLPEFFIWKNTRPGQAMNFTRTSTKNPGTDKKKTAYKSKSGNRTDTRYRPDPADPLENARRILNVSQNSTKKEIQAAYRKAVKKYHPDKLSHLGEEFSKLANEKFLEIQNAYALLMKNI